MKKRLFAGLLTAALLLGMIPPIPTQAVGADAGTGNGAEEVATGVTGGTYTDTTADPNATYEYVIEGSDGSREAVTVGPKSLENTGNKVDAINAGAIYVRTSAEVITEGQYVIVSTHGNAAGYAVSPTTDCPWEKSHKTIFNAANDFTGDYSALEWTITPVGSTGKYTIKKDNNYLNINATASKENSAVTLGTTSQDIKIAKRENNNDNTLLVLSRTIGNGEGYLNHRHENENQVATWSEGDDGSCFRLYKKHTGYLVNLSGMRVLIEQAKDYDRTKYDATSVATFEQALTNAEAYMRYDSHSYMQQQDADKIVADANNLYTILWNAMLHLVPVAKKIDVGSDVIGVEEVSPSIIWQRTLEYGYNSNDRGQISDNVPTYSGNSAEQLQKIIWGWDSIQNLTTDPTMTVWDYGKGNQYTDKNKITVVEGVKAATWDKGTNDWLKSTIRKFSGEFLWPKGYDLDDRAKLVSVNDSNYKAIYDYINEGKNFPENDYRRKIYNRYRGATVMPINDDMYAFIYKDGETLNADNYQKYMVYWSGTSGKGVWSSSLRGEDWSRRDLPDYYGKTNVPGLSAIPAFFKVMPNLQDSQFADPFTYTNVPDTLHMKHTDGWYTLANTSAIMSTLNGVYPNYNNHRPLDGQKMRIDIYCFNNNATGGMDQLELKFIKQSKENVARVTVKYYLDSVAEQNLLGSDVMTGVPYGTQINLMPNTNRYGLNHYKALAYTKIKPGEILHKDGEQLEKPYVVQQNKDNVIEVVYKRQTEKDTDYTYDFGVTNEYNHVLREQHIVDVKLVSSTGAKNLTVSHNPGTNTCKIIFDPMNSKRETATAILEVTSKATEQSTETRKYRETVRIHAASNVLYEEDYLTPTSNLNKESWTLTSSSGKAMSVADNDSTVFGYANAYDLANPNSDVYSATVYPSGSQAGKMSTADLKTKFKGNGIDLIGTCASDTGTLFVRIDDAYGRLVKGYIINTSYNDPNRTNNEIHHVPMLHWKTDAEGEYTITTRGVYMNYNAPNTANVMTMSQFAEDKNVDVSENTVSMIYEQLYDMGLTDEDFDKVEFLNVSENEAIQSYAVQNEGRTGAQLQETKATPPASMKVAIDGFRVYGSTNNNVYPSEEKGLEYKNVIECLNGEFGAYVEKTPNGTYDKTNYELAGGPQYEVYLNYENTKDDPATSASKALGLAVTGGQIKQVSLRSVTGEQIEAVINGTQRVTVKSSEEMYFEVNNPQDIMTVKMETETPTALLAIGNVKITGKMKVVGTEEIERFSEMLSMEVPENQQDTKPEGQQDTKPEGQQDTKPEGQQNSQSAGSGTSTKPQNKPSNGGAVQTGDTTNLMMMVVIVCLSGAVVILSKRKRYSDK